MGDSNKNVLIAALASILFVAAVIDITVATDSDIQISTTNKAAAEGICANTDYKETCHESLKKSNSSDPKALVQTAIDYTINTLRDVLKNSTLLKKAASDKSTKAALDVCDEVLDRAVDDLRRSVEEVGVLSASKINDMIEDLKTWLSAVITYEDTCIDAFENTTGDTGEKMKKLLKTVKELSSNGLAMVSVIQKMLTQLDLSIFTGRKLLWYERRELGALKPNAVVSQKGNGQFKSINDAIKTVPEKNNRPFVILVKAGLYKEYVEIPKKKNFIIILGEGPDKTRVTGNKNYADGTKTFQTATVAVNADDFMARDIAFENTAGPQKHQAVALRVSGDRAIFHNVNIDGYQDSLYAHTYRQFYRLCRISGTVDFVFGDSLAIFQKCTFIVRKPMDNQACMVTAQGRTDQRSQGVILIQGSSIEATKAFLDTKPPLKAYLGRPWKELSRTIIMFSHIGGFIAPEGWSEWNGDFALNTLYYAEYQNTGPGANQNGRVKWKGIQHLGPKEAEKWGASAQLNGDQWVKSSGIPYWPTVKFDPKN